MHSASPGEIGNRQNRIRSRWHVYLVELFTGIRIGLPHSVMLFGLWSSNSFENVTK